MKRFILLLLSLVLAFSCAKHPLPDSITISPSSDIVSTSNGGTYSIIVNSSSNWNTTIQSSSGTTWCTIFPEKGDASTDKATIIISNNTEDGDRQATITFVCGDAQQSINVVQETNEVMSVSNNRYEVGSEGGLSILK